MTAHPDEEGTRTPTVSIILPTYNRARFLPQAFDSIAGQQLGDWELVVVDDGSTDETAATVEAFRSRATQPVLDVRQENRGAYGARNTGLDHARAPYVAFFDSDDLWLPHHLARCVAGLDAHPGIDWVYGACRTVDEQSGETISRTTFEVAGAPRPFRALRADRAGDLHMITDPRVLECQIEHGLCAGLQNSVIRHRLFDGRRFWEDYRVVEDVLFLVRVLLQGARLAYYDDVHVIYRVHDDNSSASVAGGSARRLLPIFEEQVRGLERLRSECELPPAAARVLTRHLAHVYFWRLGYSGYWQTEQHVAALRAFRAALRLTPGDARMWKMYLLSWLRAVRPRLASPVDAA